LVAKVKEQKMANKNFGLGILAIVLVFGIVIVGCNNDPSNNNEKQMEKADLFILISPNNSQWCTGDLLKVKAYCGELLNGYQYPIKISGTVNKELKDFYIGIRQVNGVLLGFTHDQKINIPAGEFEHTFFVPIGNDVEIDLNKARLTFYSNYQSPAEYIAEGTVMATISNLEINVLFGIKLE
jgi:hypothetical protein